MMRNNKLYLILIFFLIAATGNAQDEAIVIEAEDADSIGSDFEIGTDLDITFVTPLTDFAGTTNPGTVDKVLIFEVTFTAPGTYEFYAKVRVGPEGYNDDSFYFASGFGLRPADVDSGWVRINNIDFGATGPGEYIVSREENTAGFEVFKWINASETGEGAAGGTLFVVEEGALTQTFLLGARENGLDIDKIAFGNADLFYTVTNLENGEAGVSEVPDLGNTLIVDLSSSIRSATHCASGALYGITEELPNDIAELVAPLNPRMYVQPAVTGTGHQWPFGGALPVSERLQGTPAEVTIRLPDINPNFPYQWIGWEDWEAEVTDVINQKLASGRDNYYGYELWNEQHGTWNASANGGDFFSVLWKPTHDLVRSLDPGSKIIGPSDSYYLRSRMSEFLTFCLNNDCLPDIIAWHELLGADNISRNIDDYRLLESSLGISPREISINEYSHSIHEYEGCPGVSAPFIAKFERKQVHSAAISWWFTNLPGRLGSLLTASNEKGGGWWFYKWYGEMSGDMVAVTPPSENGDGIDGFACLDVDAQYASICLGGDYTGTLDVVINGIPASFGEEVYVRVQYVPWTDKDTPVSGPVTISTTNYQVADGSISVPVEVENSLYGYRVYVSTEVFLSAQSKENEVFVYPNPVVDQLNINFTEHERFMRVRVLNLSGQVMIEDRLDRTQSKIDMSPLADGIYILETSTSSGLNRMRIIKLAGSQ